MIFKVKLKSRIGIFSILGQTVEKTLPSEANPFIRVASCNTFNANTETLLGRPSTASTQKAAEIFEEVLNIAQCTPRANVRDDNSVGWFC